MSGQKGLRERKKEQARQAIVAAALRLFDQLGFDRVTVADVAAAANVSEKTIFNYFATKYDLVYDQDEAAEEELLRAVRERAPQTSVLAAVGTFLLDRYGSPYTREESEALAATARIIRGSPTLAARGQLILRRYARSLAAAIAEEIGADAEDVEPRLAAHALIALQRTLLESALSKALAGKKGHRLGSDVRADGERALALLEQGFGSFAIRKP